MTGGVHGFSPALTSFVGRADAVAQVAGLLGRYRLVTVAGPGGVGKTRLAGEVARRVADRFADGVWLVELAKVRDPGLVGAAVAEVLGIPLAAGKPAGQSLAPVLARLQALVVLDNCEHVLDAAAALCAELLPAADDVRVLATSREPLGLAGETRYRLLPLGLPGPDSADGSEAVALFADRARQVVPGFTVDGETGPVVARLVARLDGVPLAIELAAARVEALGVGQLLARLDDRFGLLVGADRTAAPRQRSLAAAVDWSYQLLDERERRVFRHLAVFPGPFTLDAAAAVAGAAAEPAVLHLVDCSLLAPPRAGPDGRARYVLLETLRAFGAARLAEAGEQAEAAAALARYALTVAEQANAGLQSSTGELGAARWLDAEDTTTQQALVWAVDHAPETALRLALALAPWWGLRQRWATGPAELLRVAASHSSPGDDAWCAAQMWLGRAAHNIGDLTGAIDHFNAAYHALAPGGPSPALIDALEGRAGVLLILGRIAEGTEDAHRVLALARELHYPAGQARALNDLYFAAYCSGDTGSAADWARQACQVDPAAIPGRIARHSRTHLALALVQVGELAAARRGCADALTAAQDAGDMFIEAECLLLFAELEWRAGNLTESWAYLARTLLVASHIGAWIALADCLDLCGHLCAAARRWADAVTMWAAFAARLAQDGTIDLPQSIKEREEPMRQAARGLDPGELRAAQERGAAMTLATAAEFAALLADQIAPEPATPPTAQATPEPAAPPALAVLSPRERELVTLVARGRTDAQIAAQLYISIRTVRSHMDRIRDKSGCRRRADLTRLALLAGLV